MMKYRRFLVVAALASASIAAQGAEPCASNFNVEKDIYATKRYSTWQTFEGVAPAAAFKHLYHFVSQDGGWNITSSDAAAGIISANQPVSFSDGKTVPLNIVVEDHGGGSKVSLNYATAGGLHSPQDAVMTHFCKMLAQVQ